MPVFRVIKNENYTTMSNRHLRDKTLSLKAKGLHSMLLSLPDEWKYSVNGLAEICLEGRGSINAVLRELEAHGYLVRRQGRMPDGTMAGVEYWIYEEPRAAPSGADPGGEAGNGGHVPPLENADVQEPDAKEQTAEGPHEEESHGGEPRDEESQGESPLAKESQAEYPPAESPRADIPHTDFPRVGNATQTSTNKTRKEETIKEKSKGGGAGGEMRDPPRHRHGQYKNVLLSDGELEKLREEFPSDWRERIERLSEYMASTGKGYRSHLATIRSWARRERGGKTGREYRHENYRCGEGDSL